MTDQLQEKMNEVLTGLIGNNAAEIARELQNNPDGKLSVGCALKLQMVGHKVYLAGTLAYSRKFSDEAESMFEVEDPRQPELVKREDSKATVTISGPDGHETPFISVGKFSAACKAIAKGKA